MSEIETIRAWRKSQHDQGLPDTLEDYFKLNDLCNHCHGRGYLFTGDLTADLKFVNVGTEPCPYCGGSGKFTPEP